MDPRTIGQVALGIYTVLLGVGGYIGYAKAGSRPSLIAGLGSAAVALLALGLSFAGLYGYATGLILAVALVAMFGVRYSISRKFMPSGMLLGVSLVMIGLMGWAISTYR